MKGIANSCDVSRRTIILFWHYVNHRADRPPYKRTGFCDNQKSIRNWYYRCQHIDNGQKDSFGVRQLHGRRRRH